MNTAVFGPHPFTGANLRPVGLVFTLVSNSYPNHKEENLKCYHIISNISNS